MADMSYEHIQAYIRKVTNDGETLIAALHEMLAKPNLGERDRKKAEKLLEHFTAWRDSLAAAEKD